MKSFDNQLVMGFEIVQKYDKLDFFFIYMMSWYLYP